MKESVDFLRNNFEIITPEFLKKYENKQPNWGFNGLGYLVYKRCVAKNTLVLCDDLTWRPAGELKEGDGIIGFDESPISKHKNKTRYIRYGRVTHNKIEKAHCLGVELEDGTIVYATPEHSWLVKYQDNTCVYWRETKDLQETKKHNSVYLMRPFGQPWAINTSHEIGYLSGIFDGEGSIDGTCGVHFVQVQNSVLDKTIKFLKNNDFSFTKTIKSINTTYEYKKPRQQCYSLRCYGLKNIFRFLGIVRPERLLNNFKKQVIEQAKKRFGKQLNCDPADWIKVIRVFNAGEMEIAVLSTDIRTHFTDGFASHNTYSRIKGDGETEEWKDTVARCVNGAQKIGAQYTKEEAEQLYDLVFNLKCNFSGRMLWQLGTNTVDRFGVNSLINCFFIQINSIDAFCFLFENLMLGGGIGFSVRREDIHELPRIKKNINIAIKNTKDADFIVPDSREGWVKLLKQVLEAFLVSGQGFSYSTILVRSAGEPIRGFGGTASGPKILEDGITNICKVCKSREGKKLRSIDVLDICNIIGSIVVAGNVRRSAQIALGDSDDVLFLRAKRWDLETIPAWRSMSNNTIYADDYDYIMENVWDGYAGNGEPYGFFNLGLAQTQGRLGEKVKDNAIGLNPCQPSWAKVLTIDGWTNLGDVNAGDKIWSKEGWTKVLKKWSNGIKKVYKYETEIGCVFYGTKNHQIIQNGRKIEVDDAEFIDCFSEGEKTRNWDRSDRKTKKTKPYQILSREYISTEEVFDITVDNQSHTYWTGGLNVANCGEIALENGEVCNLAELNLNNIESKEELIQCAKLLYKTQKAICNNKFIHSITEKVVHKNFRLGLGITGICQSLSKLDWLDDCYKELKKYDKEWSKRQGWPESIKLTTTKPSGTISLLSGSTPGIHPSFSRYYIRRIRMSAHDSLVTICKSMGYDIEFVENFDGSLDRSTVIVSFPCCVDENTIIASAMSAIQQLELVKRIQTIWADNAVSCTVYYKKEELEEIKEWLRLNYKDSIKSVSFLLHKDHGFKQAPYTEIDEKTYKEIIMKVKPLTTIHTRIGNDTLDNLECSNGSCPIK